MLPTGGAGDGTRDGYDVRLTRTIADRVGIPVIAAGGVGTLDPLYEGLTAGGADAVLAASIFHYREFTVAEAKEHLRQRGVPVRPAFPPAGRSFLPSGEEGKERGNTGPEGVVGRKNR